jgi:DNA-binding NarL/FixJ family response regulator
VKPSVPARIFLVEDHQQVRRQLESLIQRAGGFHVCGFAENANTALSQIIQILPDLVLLDLSLKDSSGFSVLKTLRVLQPDLPILVLSIHDAASYAEPAIKAGARGYMTKQEAVYQLRDVMEAVLARQPCVTTTLSAEPTF